MCLSEAHGFAKQELFMAVRLFMARTSVAGAVLHDDKIFIVIGGREFLEKNEIHITGEN